MTETLLQKAKRLASRPYPFQMFFSPESSIGIQYLAKNPDLPGCMAQGASQGRALQHLDAARIDLIHFLLKRDKPVPEPSRLVPHVPIQGIEGVTITHFDVPQIPDEIPDDMQWLYTASIDIRCS